MQLEETLQICLLVLECRYPLHFVDMNKTILGSHFIEMEGWQAREIIQFLQLSASDLLCQPALLVIDPQKSEIYLLEYSNQIPAMVIHCQGRVLSPRKSYVQS